MAANRTYVELFAGCGGLSLGFASLGFELLLANELSSMAAESYAYNLLATDLSDPDFSQTNLEDRQVLWFKSRYPADRVAARLLEIPLEDQSDGYSDLDGLSADLRGRLVVADIRQLNDYAELGGTLDLGKPDIISGGPPCQSFSMAGLRQYGNHRNRLPWEFARFVRRHQPKLVVLENVSGILHPFREGNRKVYAWFEVAKAFSKVGYAPICLHVNAVNVGVAQNRPRFLMFAVRRDLVDQVETRLGAAGGLLRMGRELLDNDGEVEFRESDHRVIDLRKAGRQDPISRELGHFFLTTQDATSVMDAIGDLSATSPSTAPYVKGLDHHFSPVIERPPGTNAVELSNHEFRNHSGRVKARFRLYQLLAHDGSPTDLVAEVQSYMRQATIAKRGTLSNEAAVGLLNASDRASLPILDEEGQAVTDRRAVQHLVERLGTRKHSQRALRASLPAPAALSIPDDACHYRELRTLSVREMARIQSFPDSFVFRSIPTTGGARRRYQVPQYTQVGNAVPPLLGRAIGQFADFLLS